MSKNKAEKGKKSSGNYHDIAFKEAFSKIKLAKDFIHKALLIRERPLYEWA